MIKCKRPKSKQAPILLQTSVFHTLTILLVLTILAGRAFISIASICIQTYHNYVPNISERHLEEINEWKHLENHGDIELLYKPVEGTHLYAHRAVGRSYLPFHDLVDVFLDTANSTHWIKDLIHAEEYPYPKTVLRRRYKEGVKVEKAIVKQQFLYPPSSSLVFPPSRQQVNETLEYLLKRTTLSDHVKKMVVVKFASKRDETNVTVCGECKRGIHMGSEWMFQELDNGATRVQADILLDPPIDLISPFLMKNAQKMWIVDTMHGLFKELRHKLDRDSEIQVPIIMHTIQLWR
eukprot:scaffold421175_cov51-Attheya_sp.AAC.5